MILAVFSESKSWLVEASIWACLASIGGILVLLGVWMEGPPDEKPFRTIDEFHGHKLKAKRGWKLLMAGILLEVVLGFGFAIKEAWNAKETARLIAKNDPLNKPISSIVATMHFNVKPVSRNDAPSEPQTSTEIEFLEKDMNKRTLNLGKFSGLFAAEVTTFEHAENGIRYPGMLIEFRVSPFYATDFIGSVIADNRPITPRLFMDQIRVLRCYLTFLKNESEILDGTTEVVINGTFRKEFKIYPQKTFKEPSDWRTNSNGSYFYATNLVN